MEGTSGEAKGKITNSLPMGKQKKIAKGQQNYQREVVNFVISSAVYLSLGFGKPCHPLSLSFASYSMGREPLACEAKEL